MSRVTWKPVLGTRNWSLEDEDRGVVLRQLLIHDSGAPGWPSFEVTGEGHESSVHTTFYEAKAAAEASL